MSLRIISIIELRGNKADNPEAHYLTTGPEIFLDCDGEIDVFIACIGTGGTVSGIGKYLKEKNKNIKVIGVEPYDSPLITKGVAGPHGIQGIGANFIPENLDMSVIDEVVTAKIDDATALCRLVAKKQGLLVGISSGAALGANVSGEHFARWITFINSPPIVAFNVILLQKMYLRYSFGSTDR